MKPLNNFCNIFSKGEYFQLGDSFWTDSTCAQKCTCSASGLHCHNQPCSFSKICQKTSSHFFCQTVQRRTCTISGDPHYYTFDKALFHFQGTCTYVLSEQCGLELPYYRVEGKNEHRGSTRVAWTRLVKLYVYGETIDVPNTYQNATCGLCGNFNNDHSDDFRTRQGAVVSSDVGFANSWKTSGHDEDKDDDDHECGVHCEGLSCAACTEDQSALYNNADHCGILLSNSGPFAVCHQQLPPQSFVESCVYDLCVGGGYQPILCQALNVYASQCQQNGIQLPNWRRQGFCGMSVRCPATCINPNSTQNCPLPAQESCICDSGYILSGGVCVPEAECGCSFEDRYYRSGETVILGDDCGRRCSCSHGSMTCQSYGCGPLETCSVEQGERGCRPNSYATCWISGPGSYHTFDGVTYQYPGACRLTLAKVMESSPRSHFMVTVEKDPRGQQGFVKVLNYTTLFKSFYRSSINSIILRTSFGVTVQTVFPHFVRVTAPGIYNGSLGGLCGDYNGQPDDDYRTPDGTAVSSSQDFGDSWRDGPLSADCVDSGNSNSSGNSSEQCGILVSPHGPFTQCWATVDPQQYMEACREVIRASMNPASALCEFLRDYVLICQQRGVPLRDWRNSGCQIKVTCLNHCVYLSLDSCPSTCPSLSFPFTCDTVCQEGCQCNDGLVLNGHQCVPPTSCGCYHQGRYHEGGEQFLDGEECQHLCTCDGTTGLVQCVPNSCGPQESCRVVGEKTCGLCGNFNGNSNDDFLTPTGQIVTTPDEFGTAWKVAGNYTCSDGCGSSCHHCSNEQPARAQCQVLQAADGPFSFCHEQVDPTPYFNDCVFDVCVSGSRSQDLLCRAMQAYVSKCQQSEYSTYGVNLLTYIMCLLLILFFI
uniref:VWFD domain-containing protein n=1 Tax=Anabas testudineus TaxID=64144 RepID=A0A3Q1K905_ANATE